MAQAIDIETEMKAKREMTKIEAATNSKLDTRL